MSQQLKVLIGVIQWQWKVVRWFILILSLLLTSVCAAQSSVEWHLSPSSYAESILLNHSPFSLHRPLRIGIVEDAPVPFSIQMEQERSWEGITADMLAIITHALSLKTEIIPYTSRQLATTALAQGEIDVLGEENHKTPLMAPLQTSRPYVNCLPLLVGKRNEFKARSKPLSGRVALIRYTVDPQVIRAANPEAEIIEYESAEEVFRALLNHEVEWLVGDMVTVMYHLKLADYAEFVPSQLPAIPTISYRFVFSPLMSSLKEAFEDVLTGITSSQQSGLLRFWGWSEIEQPSSPQLTNQELAWIQRKHPVIKLLVNETFPPYSYLDQQGMFQGIASDILSEIGNRTGLRFEVIPASTLSNLLDAFQSEKGNMVTTATPTHLFQDNVLYTRPYVTGRIALIERKGSSLRFDQLQGVRLAVASTALREELRRRYPEAHLLEASNSLQAFTMIMEGRADAAATYLLTANYLISHYFSGDLERGDILPNFVGSVSFAIDKRYPNAKLLQGILDKGIVDLGVGYGAMLSQQWREHEADERSVWVEHVQRSSNIMAFSLIILSLLLFWIIYLYRQRLHRQVELDYWRFRGTLFDGIPQPIAVRDLSGRFVQCNSAFYTQSKLTETEVIGVRTAEFIGVPPDFANQSEQYYFTLLKSNQSGIRDVEVILQGELHYFREWSVPYTRGTQCAGLITGWIDLTEVERMARELQYARDQALQASQAKSQFLAVMSHEIRTPLNAIIGALEITLKRVDRDKSWDRDAIEAAHSASIHLSALIGDILDMAKIEAGRLALTPQPVLINKLLSGQIRVFQSLARQKGLSLTLYNKLPPNACYQLDENAFRQVVSNVLSNAIKFTHTGEITLTAYPLPEQDGLQLDIFDTGCGIPTEQQSTLFSPFSQAKQPNGERYEGTGLGLAICRQLCQLMGGEISLNSQFGVGTLVSIILPLPIGICEVEDTLPPTAVEPISSHQTLTILLVDDHSANRWVLAQQLSFLGHRTLNAEQGEQALALYTTTPVDIVITDCNMPVMNGYELTRRIRQWEQQNQHSPVPIIGFTANAQNEERTACLKVGMNACLFKPISLDEMSTCLSQWSPPTPTYTLFDFQQFHTVVQEDRNKGIELLTELLKNNQQDLTQLTKSNTPEEEAALVHRILGAARMLRIIPLCEACECYRTGELSTVDKIQSLMQQWQQELELEYARLNKIN